MDKTKFLEESPGNASVMRIAFIMLISYSIAITTILVFKEEYVFAISMFTTVNGVAFGGKLYQKNQEKK